MALDLRGVTTLLQVYDMPTSVRFYRDVLGFRDGEPFAAPWRRSGSLSLVLVAVGRRGRDAEFGVRV